MIISLSSLSKYTEMWRMNLVSTKMLFTLTILLYFGGIMINCNEDIPICDMQLKQLKEDMKNWEKICVKESLGNLKDIKPNFVNGRRESNSSYCRAENKYLKERMRMHSNMCFYEGPYPEEYVLLAAGTSILAMDLTTYDTKVIVDGKQILATLDFDAFGKKIYFAEWDKEIRRANYDGTYKESAVKDAKARASTIDWIGRRIFWIDIPSSRIYVATLDGKDSRLLIGTRYHEDITFDPIEGYLFFIYNGIRLVRRSMVTKKDKDISRFLNSNRYDRNGATLLTLALDHLSKRLYVQTHNSRNTRNEIIGMDYNGMDRNIIMEYNYLYTRSPFHVIGDLLYLNSNYLSSMIKVNVTSKDILGYIPLPKGKAVSKILVVDKNRQAEGKCQCLHGYCSIINGSESCHCDQGFNFSGQACTDIDECLSPMCYPASIAYCKNSPGSYSCTCKKGFSAVNRTSCVDINECQSQPYCGCQLNPEKCVNTEGSCKCECAEDIPSNDTECFTYSDLQIRLNGSSNNMSGRIQIYHPRLGWGMVCSRIHIGDNVYKHLKNTAANVVCRQLGFSGGTVIRTLYYYGKRSGISVILSNVQCSGDESFIWDCSHDGWNFFPRCISFRYGPVRVNCY